MSLKRKFNGQTICHRTVSMPDRTWRTGWRASSSPTRTLRRPWRSASRGWRATPPPSARWGPWLRCWAWPTWEASIGDVTSGLTVPRILWTGETSIGYFTCSFAQTWSVSSAAQVQCLILTCCLLRISASHLWFCSNNVFLLPDC